MALLGLFGRKRHERAGYELYNAAVQAARDPYFYTALGVPDTLDGRFDMVGIHVFLVVDRLHGELKAGAELAQAVFDAMFADMDFNLRELGVGDMTVGKKVRAMWEAFHGRANAYAAPLAARDADSLAEIVARNVWRGQPAGPGARAIADGMIAQAAALALQPVESLTGGTIRFLAAQPA